MIFRLFLFLFLLPITAYAKINTIYLAGGCFWCVEEVYEKLKGVIDVRSGYSGGHVENPTYQEVVKGDTGHIEVAEIIFDSDIVSIDTIIRTFFLNIDPFDAVGQCCDKGYSYRSGAFFKDDEQRKLINKSKRKIEQKFNKKVVTYVIKFDKFYEAENYLHDYFTKNPQNLYCQAVINPKLKKLRSNFSDLISE